MYLLDGCPCCRTPMTELCPALVAPFLAERVLGGPSRPCALLTCPACGFRGFDARYDDEEMDRLYGGYRGEAYFRTRHRWEPWYTRKMNASLGDDPGELATRKANAAQLISRCLGGAAPARILDYGGDRGQFIPDCWASERFVYDVSGAEPLQGVTSLDASALVGASFDLVMVCHVLEHLSDPAAQLEVLLDLIGDAGSLYVEVPLERPDLRWAGAWPWRRPGLAWLAGHRWLLTLVDLYSTWFRIRRNIVPPGGFLKASEHLNFFTLAGLRALLDRNGFRVVACEEMTFDGAFSRATALGCVARRAEP